MKWIGLVELLCSVCLRRITQQRKIIFEWICERMLNKIENVEYTCEYNCSDA